MNVIGPFMKKLENLLFSENVMIGQSSSKCPSLSVRCYTMIYNIVATLQRCAALKVVVANRPV